MGLGCWIFWLLVGDSSEAWVNSGTIWGELILNLPLMSAANEGEGIKTDYQFLPSPCHSRLPLCTSIRNQWTTVPVSKMLSPSCPARWARLSAIGKYPNTV
jgi:hypothetical protein